MKELYGLLGKNIGYSFSRGYFSEKFQKEKLDHQYTNFDLDRIEDVTDLLHNPDIKGMNVTIPYKEEIIPFLDKLDPIAQEIGAVNVIKFEKGEKTIGYNSDYYGFTTSLEPLLHADITKALILGTGGASKAIAFALGKLGIDHTFVSRNSGAGKLSYSDLNNVVMASNKLIINCTPLGTHPDIKAHPDIPYHYLTEKHVLYDLIYNPDQTAFMKKGLQQGAKVTNGLKMLILQAEKSWEIWNS